jgi:ATP-dependent RNA helicase RhlB
MEFNELNLPPDLRRGIAETGYVTCMPVQEQVLTNAFGGQDLYVQSQTGTGKTAAFLIVIFQRLLSEPLLAGRKAIIMVPTRELAVQVEEEAKILGKYLPFKVGSFYGGVGYTQQQQLLRDNAQILVGTPGRVLDLNKSGHMNLMDIAFLVLDEADRMFDMGFYPDLRKLIKVIPPADKRQTMLFSATLNAWVKNLAWEYTKSPLEIEIAPETVTVEEIEQVLYHVPSNDKMRLLLGILEREKPESAIIFCNTKRYTEIAAKRLRANGIDCEFIIGDLPQSRRLKIIEDVKAGKTRFLVATDVAARGLDIESLAMVINYDLPVESENYVHRIGRTGRAGLTGKAVTLASEQDVYELPAIERYIGKKIPSSTADESLFAEDKSAGMRIHTGVYDDRRERGERHGEGRRGEGRRGEDRRDRGGSRPSPDRGRRESRRDGAAGEGFREDRGRKKKGPQTKGPIVPGHHKAGTRKNGAGLTSLSFEERMAYYKEKYAGEGRRGTGTERDGGRKSPRAPGQAPAQGQKGPGQRPPRRQAKGPPRTPPPARSAQIPAPEAAPPKKGLLGRFMGLFKKKPDPLG